MFKATVENGNKEVTITVSEGQRWTGGNNERVYYDIKQDNKRNVLASLYEVVQGTTRDDTIEANGRTFGYQFGFDAGSKTKRRNAIEGIEDLVKQIVSK